MLFQKRVVGTKFDVYGFFLVLTLHLIIKLMRVLISYVVAIVVFRFLSVSTAKLHLLVEQEQLTLSELLRSPPVCGGVLVAWSFCMVFCRSLLVFGHWIVCSSIYGFWLPLWYLQTVFNERIYIFLEFCINLSYGVKQDDSNILKILRFIYIIFGNICQE